jgi:hypothetical protein
MEKKMTSKVCHNSAISAILPHILLSGMFPLGLLLFCLKKSCSTSPKHNTAQPNSAGGNDATREKITPK